MFRFFILFVVILLTLFAVEVMPQVNRALVVPWTEALVRISAALITLFDSHVAVFGDILQSTTNGFGLAIKAGCNGVEAAMILIAAMLAFPAPWRYRVIGILVGLTAVQLLNIVRVISLFYLGQWSMKAFEWAHFYVWQALIMLDVLVVWMIWIRSLPRLPATVAPPAPAADTGAEPATAA
jgi:exosortase H (IPTLxxWG-CTERM-specific)